MFQSLRTGLFLTTASLASFPGGATAETLFSDNFEIIANGGNDTDSTNDTAPLPPLHADIGSYSDPNTNGRVAAYGAALLNPTPVSPNGTAPATFEGSGSHLLRLQPPPSSGSRVAAFLSQPASVAGSTFHMEFDLYATSNINFGFGSQNRIPFEGGQTFGLINPGRDRPRQSVQFNLVSTGGVINIFRDLDDDPSTGNAQVATGLTYTTNTFQRMQVDYVIGSNQLTLTAGTQTPVVISMPFLSATDTDFDNTNGLTPQSVSSISQVDAIFFGTGSNGSVGYVDNILVTGTAFAGDANHDLLVDTIDFNALAGNFGVLSNASWGEGDFNADNKVDSVDFNLLVGNYGASYEPPLALGTTVPEPAIVSGLVFAGFVAIKRPRQSRTRV